MRYSLTALREIRRSVHKRESCQYVDTSICQPPLWLIFEYGKWRFCLQENTNCPRIQQTPQVGDPPG